MPAQLPDFTAWLLGDVKTALASEPEWSALKVRVVETAPPAAKPRSAGPERQGAVSKSAFRTTQPGEWRVLRSRAENTEIELLVAREELRAEANLAEKSEN